MKSYKTIFLLIGLLNSAMGNSPNGVIILANSKMPESVETARYYAQERGIPLDNIIALPMSTKETITLKEYVKTVHNPLLESLFKKDLITGAKSRRRDIYGRDWLVAGLHSIDYLVLMYGVPLRFQNSPEYIVPTSNPNAKLFQNNQGSLDSELALLAVPSERSMTGFSKNPLFKNKTPSTYQLETLIRVNRLDGPSSASVRLLIDRTLAAEKTGLQGRAYFDLGGPHKMGDEWFQEAADLARGAHFDTSIESSKRILDSQDRLDAPAIYMGWYSRNANQIFKQRNRTVPKGAVALHLHSFSATTVRTKSVGWVGPLVQMGFSATVGNVYEPYLSLTHHPALLLEALLEGKTFGEAAHYSISAYSWMNIALGDPLYRPFGVTLDTQLKESNSPYVILRAVNRLDSESGTAAATRFLGKHFQEKPSLPLAYALAKRHIKAGDLDAAAKVLRLISYIDVFLEEEFVLIKHLADLSSDIEEYSQALTVYEKLLKQKNVQKPLKLKLLEDGVLICKQLNNNVLMSQWSRDLLLLKAPRQ